MKSISQRIAEELDVREWQVEAAISLLDAGAYVPFIARYRKEATGTLDDTQLRTLEERLRYLRELEDRRAAILGTSASRASSTMRCGRRSRRRTARRGSRTSICRTSRSGEVRRRSHAKLARAACRPAACPSRAGPAPGRRRVRQPGARLASIDAALDGARAILTERFAEDAELIGSQREEVWSRGRLLSRVRDGKAATGIKFADYFDYGEKLTKLPSHRILALFRGEKEEVLDLPTPTGRPAREVNSAAEVFRATGRPPLRHRRSRPAGRPLAH